MINLRWTTMPIPERGATFAFKAEGIMEDEIIYLLDKNNLDYEEIKDRVTVWLIGHKNCNDHIATYVPHSKTLFTNSRESFRVGSAMDMYDTITSKVKVDMLIAMLKSWREDAEKTKGKKLSLDIWGINMLIEKVREIKEGL